MTKSKDPNKYKNARVSDWYDHLPSTWVECPFCHLKDKYIIHETDEAVLTVNLYPYIDGHLLVIPKRHIESFEDMSDEVWMSLKNLLKVGINALKEVLEVSNTNVLYREGAGGGVSVGHVHIHLFPITSEFMKYEKTRFVWTFQKLSHSPEEMAKKLREHVKNI